MLTSFQMVELSGRGPLACPCLSGFPSPPPAAIAHLQHVGGGGGRGVGGGQLAGGGRSRRSCLETVVLVTAGSMLSGPAHV